jgi:3-hydroxyisobutyrate dehydrogenase
MRLGFIGTGKIGNPMARNLIGAGHDLVVNDLRPAACANLLELGATWVESPAAVAAETGVIFTSLPGPLEVEAVLTGPAGILAGAQPGAVYFDLSTNAPSLARRLAALAAERGVTYLDAPVSGGVSGAEKATLAVMVGGDHATFDSHRPLLEAIGANVFHLGDVGAGCTAKLANNLIALGVSHLLNESLVMGVKAGIDARTLYEVMNVASASRFVQGVPRLLERHFDEPTFTLALAAKDVGLAVGLGREHGVPMPASAAIEQTLLAATAAGYGERASSVSMLWLESLTGVEAR